MGARLRASYPTNRTAYQRGYPRKISGVSDAQKPVEGNCRRTRQTTNHRRARNIG